MALTVAYFGQSEQLQSFITSNLRNGLLRLYQNDLTPDEATLTTDFVEAQYSGYAAINLLIAGLWSVPILNANNRIETTFPEQTFSHSGGPLGGPVYGYFVTDPVAGGLLFSERFTDGPYSMVVPTDKISLQLRFTGDSEFGKVPP